MIQVPLKAVNEFKTRIEHFSKYIRNVGVSFRDFNTFLRQGGERAEKQLVETEFFKQRFYIRK